jgi:hypothetical protein
MDAPGTLYTTVSFMVLWTEQLRLQTRVLLNIIKNGRCFNMSPFY